MMASHRVGTPFKQLDDIDFPTGPAPPLDHPKMLLYRHLVAEHAAEYDEAGQMTEERNYRGRRMRSKQDILQLVANQVIPLQGSFKRWQRDGVWTIDMAYSYKKLRKRVSNDFNRYLNTQARRAKASVDKPQQSSRVQENIEEKHEQTQDAAPIKPVQPVSTKCPATKGFSRFEDHCEERNTFTSSTPRYSEEELLAAISLSQHLITGSINQAVTY